jgi:hypothetical protein
MLKRIFADLNPIKTYFNTIFLILPLYRAFFSCTNQVWRPRNGEEKNIRVTSIFDYIITQSRKMVALGMCKLAALVA